MFSGRENALQTYQRNNFKNLIFLDFACLLFSQRTEVGLRQDTPRCHWGKCHGCGRPMLGRLIATESTMRRLDDHTTCCGASDLATLETITWQFQ